MSRWGELGEMLEERHDKAMGEGAMVTEVYLAKTKAREQSGHLVRELAFPPLHSLGGCLFLQLLFFLECNVNWLGH